MNKQFTPGPWTISPASTESATWDEIWSGDMDTHIADMSMLKQKHWNHTGWVDAQQKEEAEANARLIAAAPEMFDELERLAQELDLDHPTQSRIYDLLDRITTPNH